MKIPECLKYLFICLFLFPCFYTSCLEQGKTGLLLDKAASILEQHPDSALSMLNTILFPEDLSRSKYNKYLLLQIQAKFKSDRDIKNDTAIFAVKDYYLKKKDFPNAALAAFYCACLYYEQEEIEKAASAYLEAREYAAHTKDDNLNGLIHSNHAILLSEQVLISEAIEEGKEAVARYDKTKNYKNEINALLLVGNCFLMENKSDSAFYYYDKGLALAVEHKMEEEQPSIKQNIGITFLETGDYANAKKSLHEALSFSIKNTTVKATILLNLANVYKLEHKLDSAKFYIEQSLSLQTEDPALLRTTYLLLSEMEEKGGNPEKALLYLKKYNELIEKIIDNNRSKALLELQGKYDFEALKNKHNEQIIWQLSAIVLLLLVFVLSILVAISYYRKYVRKEEEILEIEQKIESMKKMAEEYSKTENPETEKKVRDMLCDYFDILKKTVLLDKNISEQDKKNVKELIRKFNKIVYGKVSLDDFWKKLYDTMNDIKGGLYNWVRSQHPELNDLDFRICCLTCENFNCTEIGLITNLTTGTVQKKRSEIRKKIGISYHGDFLDFFSAQFSAN
jgi:tetratricopeptide (TPR) repeat protein/DNA-binding CsgD family transcriptional regulator